MGITKFSTIYVARPIGKANPHFLAHENTASGIATHVVTVTTN